MTPSLTGGGGKRKPEQLYQGTSRKINSYDA